MSAAENQALVGPSFDAVYSSVASRDRAVAGLKKLAAASPRDTFRAQFMACVDKLLPEVRVCHQEATGVLLYAMQMRK